MTLAESMDARGHGRGKRTSYRSEGWSAAAIAVAGVALASSIVFAFAAAGGWGSLGPSFFPLRWPDASPLLIACALLFALPAFLVPSDEESR